MNAKQALKTCERLSKDHSFICTEMQHVCVHYDGTRSNNPEFSIGVFHNGEVIDRFSTTAGFKEVVAQVKAFLKP